MAFFIYIFFWLIQFGVGAIEISPININDYEKEFSPTEITIIFSRNKHGQFINFDKMEEKYFHKYVDNKEYKKKKSKMK